MPAFIRWPIRVGNTEKLTPCFYDPDNPTEKLNLTGYEFRFSLTIPGGEEVYWVTGGSDPIVIEDQTQDATKGQVSITFSPAFTRQVPTQAELPDGTTLVAELEAKDPDGNENSWADIEICASRGSNRDG